VRSVLRLRPLNRKETSFLFRSYSTIGSVFKSCRSKWITFWKENWMATVWLELLLAASNQTEMS
jgi:hypothetical protein